MQSVRLTSAFCRVIPSVWAPDAAVPRESPVVTTTGFASGIVDGDCVGLMVKAWLRCSYFVVLPVRQDRRRKESGTKFRWRNESKEVANTFTVLPPPAEYSDVTPPSSSRANGCRSVVIAIATSASQASYDISRAITATSKYPFADCCALKTVRMNHSLSQLRLHACWFSDGQW